MDTVRARLEWIIANLPNPETGKAWDAQSLSLAAQLAPAHIGMVLRGDIGEPRRPTLAKIANAARVSLGWLITGEGKPLGDEGAAGHAGSEPDARPLVSTEASPIALEDALDLAFERGPHSLHDALAVRAAFGATIPLQGITDTVAAARAWLDAAADLRRAGKEVTAIALLERVTERMTRSALNRGLPGAEVGAPATAPSPSERPVEGTEAMPSESPSPLESGSGLREPFQVHRDEHGNLTVTGGNPIAPATSTAKPAKTAGERKGRH